MFFSHNFSVNTNSPMLLDIDFVVAGGHPGTFAIGAMPPNERSKMWQMFLIKVPESELKNISILLSKNLGHSLREFKELNQLQIKYEISRKDKNSLIKVLQVLKSGGYISNDHFTHIEQYIREYMEHHFDTLDKTGKMNSNGVLNLQLPESSIYRKEKMADKKSCLDKKKDEELPFLDHKSSLNSSSEEKQPEQEPSGSHLFNSRPGRCSFFRISEDTAVTKSCLSENNHDRLDIHHSKFILKAF